MREKRKGRGGFRGEEGKDRVGEGDVERKTERGEEKEGE